LINLLGSVIILVIIRQSLNSPQW